MEFIIILSLAVILDLLLGDPRWLPMVVVYIGKAITKLEPYLRKKVEDERWAGLLLVISIVSGTYLIIFILLQVTIQIQPYLYFLISIYLLFNAISIKGMALEAKKIVISLERIKESYHKEFWIKNARQRLAKIVGRDTRYLSEEEIMRATIESVAESITDGVISPLFYMFLGGLPLCWAYKAINTLDSMVGYKNERYKNFGYFSAKFDDVANYIPARLTALLFILAAFFLKKDYLRTIKTILRDGRKHPSPNSGLVEAGMAGALGIKLGGKNYYQGKLQFRPYLGEGNLREEIKKVETRHVKESIKFLYLVSFLMVIISLTLKVMI
ncbi:adenosylcobinamide-phosphate synthase CbiB [bacterium]|nr:adenosylcobinamide-phosphate synthase CbiB [bacterium]MBU0900322.1 adenosylcobinamide-phosphate synthase CbiB [bacterium]MBU1154089.1 adenosylcobinamide-phosphate synthase CbiB [bacterium]